MTSTLISGRSASTIPSPTMFSDQLIDGIAEAVVWSADPTARSTAISSLIGEIYATIDWLHGSNGQHEELDSLRRVVAEVHQHRARMSAAQEGGQTGEA